MFKYFDTRGTRPQGSVQDGDITKEEWIIGFATVIKGGLGQEGGGERRSGTRDELIQYTFNIYDLNDDGYIR